MAKETITLRFYWQNDLDLICLYMNPDFNMLSAIRKILVGYARNEDVKIEAPASYVPKKVPKKVQMHVQFDAEEYEDVSNALQKLLPRLKNSFIKNLLRYSLVEMDTPTYVGERLFFRNGQSTEKKRKKKKTTNKSADITKNSGTKQPIRMSVPNSGKKQQAETLAQTSYEMEQPINKDSVTDVEKVSPKEQTQQKQLISEGHNEDTISSKGESTADSSQSTTDISALLDESENLDDDFDSMLSSFL